MADTAVVSFEEALFEKMDTRIREVVNSMLRPGVRVVDIVLVIGARDVLLDVADHVFYRLGLNGQVNILSWSMAGTIAGASAAGTIRVDVQVGATLATVASICGGTGNQPTLTAVAELSDQAPTGWTTVITDPNWIMATVASTGGTLEVISLTLRAIVIPR